MIETNSGSGAVDVNEVIAGGGGGAGAFSAGGGGRIQGTGGNGAFTGGAGGVNGAAGQGGNAGSNGVGAADRWRAGLRRRRPAHLGRRRRRRRRVPRQCERDWWVENRGDPQRRRPCHDRAGNLLYALGR